MKRTRDVVASIIIWLFEKIAITTVPVTLTPSQSFWQAGSSL
jgi:hypothetical protein